MKTTDWDGNPALDAQLTALWMEGFSCDEIGRRMGLSRNAIIGRAHRIKLPPRPSPIVPHKSGAPRRSVALARRKLNRKPMRVVGVPPLPCERVIQSVSDLILELSTVNHAEIIDEIEAAYGGVPVVVTPMPAQPRPYRECMYPLWNDSERPTHRYCCLPTKGSIYCKNCSEIVHISNRQANRQSGLNVSDTSPAP